MKYWKNVEDGMVIEVGYDEWPIDPREWDNVTQMHCAHRRYTLGDKGVGLVDFLEDALEMIYIESEEFFKWLLEKEIIEEIEGSDDGPLYATQVNAFGFYREGLRDALLDYGYEDEIGICMKIAEYAGLIFSPLYLYEHSGITISTGGFSCPWDSGMLGVVWITKEDWEESMITKHTPEEIIHSEVEDYDRYLRGDVYHVRICKNNEVYESIGNVWFNRPDDKEEVIELASDYFGLDQDLQNWKEAERVIHTTYTYEFVGQ